MLPLVVKWAPRLSDNFHSIPDTNPLQRGQSKNCPAGCRWIPMGTRFQSSCKPSIYLSICTGTSRFQEGTLAFLTISFSFQRQVHSIVASPRITPLKAGCFQLPLGTSFHSRHKLSISLSICTGISSCKVGTSAFLTISIPFQTQGHSIVASLRIAPLALGVLGYLPVLASILAVSRQYLYWFVMWPVAVK